MNLAQSLYSHQKIIEEDQDPEKVLSCAVLSKYQQVKWVYDRIYEKSLFMKTRIEEDFEYSYRNSVWVLGKETIDNPNSFTDMCVTIGESECSYQK